MKELKERKPVPKILEGIESQFFNIKEVPETQFDILNKFDPIFNKEHLDSFPSGIDFDIVYYCRHAYINEAGFSIITKPFLDRLSKFLNDNNFKCLEIMAGKAVISKGLKDRNVNIVTTDNMSWNDKHISKGNGAWTDIENISAEDAVVKYNDVDVIICSWIPLYHDYTTLINNIRKHNPDVLILEIGEGLGGCTADDTWFENTYEDCSYSKLVNDLNEVLPSWFGIYDKLYARKVKK